MRAVFMALVFIVFRYRYGCCSEENNSSTDTGVEVSKIQKRAAGDPFTRRSPVDKNFIRFGRSSNYFHEKPNRTQKNHMSLARVSRAARDNFMRFGRPDTDDLVPDIEHSDNLIRLGRAKDNFMRFGRGKDNFMRFGRKDNFMRFGRKENFMRFGRSKDNFMRFGRSKDNFMRFGRDPESYKNAISEIPMSMKKDSKTTFVRFGKKDDGFIRFGRSDPDNEPEYPKIDDAPEIRVLGDLELQADKPKNGPINRSKREAKVTTLWEVESNGMGRVNRDAELVEDTPPQSTLKKNSNVKRSAGFELFMVPDQDTDSPSSEIWDSNDYYYYVPEPNEEKRAGGSSFIRFG